MGWLRVDLPPNRDPIPHDSGSARARRIELRRRLLEDPDLTGRAALALAQELRVLELREAVESLQKLQDCI